MSEEQKSKPEPASLLPNTPKSVKSLRSYWKSRDLPDPIHMFAELMGENDRATIILASSALDDALSVRIASAMVFALDHEHYDHIFRFDGPLGAFSRRIEIAYLFGLIDDVMRSQLSDIREMRNACAHTQHKIDFSVPALYQVGKRILKPTGFSPLLEESKDGMKRAFMLEWIILFNALALGNRAEAIDLVVSKLKEILAAPSPSPGTHPQP